MEESTTEIKAKTWKFKELKVYASTEWLANNRKKYRQVFDRYEVSYVYAELSFYNKLFDQEDWEVNLELKCFALVNGNRKELCSLPLSKKVNKYDNVVYVREGWGNKTEGSFWKKGTYYWEAWIDGKKEATKYFYVEDTGEAITAETNPYLELKSLRLYEGPYDDVPEEDRIYYKTFSQDDTRYIYGELIFENLNPDQKWHCEIFAKFYNQARELKGQVIRLQTIRKNEELISITVGWGSNVRSWRNGQYSLELVFMDHMLAIIPFEIGGEFDMGVPAVKLPNKIRPVILTSDEDNAESFEEVLSRLDRLVGLKAIKKQVREHSKYIQFLQIRKENGFEEKEEINVHSAFIGNPGTGKTTVAGLMGKIYRKMGLLSSGHIHEVDRSDLVGEYIGQTAPKVKEAIEKARGGVLFIDEAYALARANDDTKDFGREVIEILMKEMSNGPGDLAIVVAGYPKEMNHFLNSNPGLRSRFKHVYEFADYLPQELTEIGELAAFDKGIQLTASAKTLVEEMILDAYRKRNASFGNARFVFDLLEKAKINLGLRIMDRPKPKEVGVEMLSMITEQDVLKIKMDFHKELPNIPVDQKLLDEAMAELDSLIGMQNIKREIKEMIDLVQFYQNTGKDVLNSFNLHTVLVGNPGTGKTSIARILAKLYKALGILERGHLIETDRQGLVAGYVGQSAIKTAERIEESLGGVLFIDEAYSLTLKNFGSAGDFGDEVIQTLLKRMEDFRGEFYVFVAGYPDKMDQFLKANPGLRSRFDRVLRFEDFNPAELVLIARKMLSDKGYMLSDRADTALGDYLKSTHASRDKYFGNARFVRKVTMNMIRIQNLRLSKLSELDRERTDLRIIEVDDLQNLEQNSNDMQIVKSKIGFKSR